MLPCAAALKILPTPGGDADKDKDKEKDKDSKKGDEKDKK
jgi:hypothetical protein